MEQPEIKCPKCGSTQLTANKKGFSGTKAVGGAILTGGVGLLAGTIGSNKVKITCLSCGKEFTPGEDMESVKRKKQQEAEEDYEFYSILSKTGGTPKTQKGGENVECPPCEDGTIPTKDKEGNCSPCPEKPKQPQRRASSGDSAINDYINNLRGINADVENRFEPYPNFYADYARESENLMANAETDLPRYYEDMMAQKTSQSVNALENAIRNMSGIGSSGYLANMQAARNKELGINQQAMATSLGQEMAQRNARATQIAQNRLYEAKGAETSFDRTQEARDAIDAAKYDTEKNILTGRLAQTREDNTARRNELLDSQMQWMYNNDRTQYDKDGNPVNPDPSTKQYGGSIKRDMYEYGSRVKRERQMKSDKAINEFRSFMRGFNNK